MIAVINGLHQLIAMGHLQILLLPSLNIQNASFTVGPLPSDVVSLLVWNHNRLVVRTQCHAVAMHAG
jgi:hypothetical protein